MGSVKPATKVVKKKKDDGFTLGHNSLVESLGLGAVDLPKLPGGDSELSTSTSLMGTTSVI